MKTKYYSGPDGVFYNPKFDCIMILEHHHSRIYNIKTRKTVGLYYYVSLPQFKNKVLAVIMGKNVIRLGDL